MTDVTNDPPRLTPPQEAVVAIMEGSYTVIAPPGSGKTEIVARRIMRLLEKTSGEPTRVLALTFTKKAAAEMASRVRRVLREDSARATVTNFHGFYFDILRHYGSLIGIRGDPIVYESDDDRVEALRSALVDEGIRGVEETVERRECVAVLEQIGVLKRTLRMPDTVSDSVSVGGIPLRAAYVGYEGVLRRAGALDFDDILLRTHELLAQFPRVAKHYRSLYRYILVDEGQDTNRAQYENLKLICGTGPANVMIFADPSQSIYRFSGAGPEYLAEFERDFSASRIPLTDNFRCAKAIATAAGLLLPTGQRSFAAGAEGCVEVVTYPDEESEGAGTLDWIVKCLAEGLPPAFLAQGEESEVTPESVAVLARSRLQLRAVLRHLQEGHVEYQFATGAGGIFDTQAYSTLYLAMKVVASPTDIVLRHALTGRLGESAAAASMSDPVEAVLQRVARQLEDDERRLLECLAASGPMFSVTDTMDRLVGVVPELTSTENDDLTVGDWEMLTQRWSFFRNTTEESRRSWRDWLLRLTDDARPERPGVRVYTVHAAKGLEFRAVQIVGLNEGSFPDFRSSTPEEVEEERRLCYVAATRSSRLLRLSRPRVRATRYGSRTQVASRFIGEMGLRAP